MIRLKSKIEGSIKPKKAYSNWLISESFESKHFQIYGEDSNNSCSIDRVSDPRKPYQNQSQVRQHI